MTPAEGLELSGRVLPPEVLDNETIDTVIDSLLSTDPPPYVMAAKENALAVTVPPQVPVPADYRIGEIASALELCVPSDWPAIIEAWTRARESRDGQANVHLQSDPERTVRLHFVDARHRFGVYLGIFAGSAGVANGGSSLRPPLFQPRVCSMERDDLAVIRAVDSAVTQILGWTEADLVGTRTTEIIHPDDRPLGIANWMEMLSRPGFEQRVLLRLRHRHGNYVWFEVTNRNLLDDPNCGRVLTELVDVSETMAAVEALRANEELLRRLTAALPLGVVQVDAQQCIVYRNELLSEILGVGEACDIDEQFGRIPPPDRTRLQTALAAIFAGDDAGDVELPIAHPAGPRRCSVSMRALSTAAGLVTGAIVCVTDVTERARLREELERRAHYDTLTRCHNRTSILEALQRALSVVEAHHTGIAVVFVDLNRFKELNDRHGHAAGDELLQLTGERLMANVRAGDLVGRLGGDEFLVVCPDVTDSAAALEIAQRIGTALDAPATLGTTSIVTGSSVGVAWTDVATGCDAIVAAADEAMYRSKRTAAGPVLAAG